MHDLTAFEARLADAYARYVAAAPIDVDPRVVAETAGTRHVQPTAAWRSVFGRRPRLGVLIAVGLVVLSLAVGAALVGSQVAPRPTTLPSTGPTTAPSVAPSTGAKLLGILTPGPDMTIGRINPVVVTLEDGSVLIAAGHDSGDLDEVPAEVFDPTTSQSTIIAHDAPYGQAGGSGVLLPDGRVFVIVHDGNSTSSWAYLVDPRTMTSHRITRKEPSNAPVFGVNPTMSLLHDGRVLVAGGLADVYGSTLLETAVLFDPATETFTATGSMRVARWRHSMTTLADGRVLIAGGEGRADTLQSGGDPMPPDYLSDAELYDPTTGTFSGTGAMAKVRGATLAVTLPDGRIVVLPRLATFTVYRTLFGQPVPYDTSSPVPVEIYDPATGTFTPNGTVDNGPTSATLLRRGRILLTGILGEPASTDPNVRGWASIYDPASGRSEATAVPRAWYGAPAALPDGRVLFAGGGLPASDGSWPPDPVHWIETFGEALAR